MQPVIRLALLALVALEFGLGSSRASPLEAPASTSPAGEPSVLVSLSPATPRTTYTRDGAPGDPFNVALVGTRDEMLAAFCTAGWHRADPITLRSAVGISVSCVFNVAYLTAPMSNLYLCCRPQDLAFQKACGRSARKRHHVRFWCTGVGADGRPVWLGADTFDMSVGRSARTGKMTHHIDPDIDRERDELVNDLSRAGVLVESSLVHWTAPRQARNGEGDCYYTDGKLAVGVLRRREVGFDRFPTSGRAP